MFRNTEKDTGIVEYLDNDSTTHTYAIDLNRWVIVSYIQKDRWSTYLYQGCIFYSWVNGIPLLKRISRWCSDFGPGITFVNGSLPVREGMARYRARSGKQSPLTIRLAKRDVSMLNTSFEPVRVSVTNGMGRTVFTSTVNGNSSLGWRAPGPGTWVVRTESGGRISSEMVIAR